MRPAVALLVGQLLLAGVATADEPPASDGTPASLPSSRTSGDMLGGTESPGEIRLTGEEILSRGAGNLADALALLPEINLRTGGRGDLMLDLRSARQRAVLLRIDGVPVTEPYYGVFDLTAIPATDIVEIRLLVTPASPVDGIGGSGGIIDVITRAATGNPGAWANVQASDAPGWRASASGRGEAGGIFTRLSATVYGEDRAFAATLPDGASTQVGEGALGGAAALRIEKPFADGKIGALVSLDYGRRLLAPDEDAASQINRLDGQTDVRVVLDGDARAGGWRLGAAAYLEHSDARWVHFDDATLTATDGDETLTSDVSGGQARAVRRLNDALELTLAAALTSEHARDVAANAEVGAGRATVGQGGAAVVWHPLDEVRIDASAGGAAADLATRAAWIEALFAVTWTPLPRTLELRLLGARKGRLPTLRERAFDLDYGDPDLRPEIADEVEARAIFRSARSRCARMAMFARPRIRSASTPITPCARTSATRPCGGQTYAWTSRRAGRSVAGSRGVISPPTPHRPPSVHSTTFPAIASKVGSKGAGGDGARGRGAAMSAHAPMMVWSFLPTLNPTSRSMDRSRGID